MGVFDSVFLASKFLAGSTISIHFLEQTCFSLRIVKLEAPSRIIVYNHQCSKVVMSNGDLLIRIITNKKEEKRKEPAIAAMHGQKSLVRVGPGCAGRA